METSVLIAKLAAVVYVATGIAMLIGTFNLKKTYPEIEKVRIFPILMGCFVLVLGTLITHFHNLWVKDWRVLITIIGWALLLEGVCYILIPAQLLKFFKKLPQSQIGWGVFTLLMGLFFTYFGFIA